MGVRVRVSVRVSVECQCQCECECECQYTLHFNQVAGDLVKVYLVKVYRRLG